MKNTLLILFLVVLFAGCGGVQKPPTPPPIPEPEVVRCGDGQCTPPTETHGNCPADCPSTGERFCGDGICGPAENYENCKRDCPPPPPVCGDGKCEGAEDNATCAQDCPPLPTLPECKAGLSISFYELLSSKSWNTGTQRVEGYYLDYLRMLREAGICETRNFLDLNWFWNAKAQDGIFVMSDYLSPYQRKGNGFDFDSPDRINPEYKKRMEDAATYSASVGQTIQLTFVTEGYGNPFFFMNGGMGFTSQRHLYMLADDPKYPKQWERLQRYFGDFAKITATKDGKKVFKIFEFYNEHEGGSLVDEYTGLNKAVRMAGRVDYLNQLNMPSPIDISAQDLDGFFAWLKRLNRGYSFKINRFSFHGIFTHDDVRNIAMLCDKYSFPKNIITLATDGATPWREANGNYRFTHEHHTAHYKARKTWDDSAANRAAVTYAHTSIVKEAKKYGFTIDIQDMSKWNEQGVVDKYVKEFWAAIYAAY